MGEIKDYKCPSCGASLVFDTNTQNLHCNSCSNDFSIETMEQLNDVENADYSSKYDWEKYEPRNYENDGDINLSDYSCPSCGAEITGDETLGATICPYCGNATIVKKQFEGTLMPDYIIPFLVDKEKAMQCFEEASKKTPFLPDEFKNRKKIEEMSGVYVPFWNFDCECTANMTYDAKRIRTWRDSRYEYTRTDHYKLIREGKIKFINLPVDASKKTDDTYMEAVEPYDYSKAVEFNTAYLAGYLADRYDVSSEESIKRANERIKTSVQEEFKNTTHGFTYANVAHEGINFLDGKIRYSLMPVWMLNIKYENNNYKYAINGQTGKVVGEYPVDKKKKRWFFAKTYAFSAAIMFIIFKLIGLL